MNAWYGLVISPQSLDVRMDCSPPGSSGISQARILSWLPFLSPGDLPDPETEHASPALAGRFFTTEPPGKPLMGMDGYQMKQ